MNKSVPAKCWLGLMALGACLSTAAISPLDLSKRMRAGEHITIVDVRSTSLFQQGNIPGAINVPASLVSDKRLPRLGQVVVYDEGLGHDTATAAAATLNRKPGITAQVLEGGFAAWETAGLATTRPPGLQEQHFPFITYAQLKQSQSRDVVLVDLRHPTAAAASTSDLAAQTSATPLTDLHAEFPTARITRSPFEAPAAKSLAAGDSSTPLFVLIDSGDGASEAMARALKANGMTRFVILAGGEEMLVRRGQPGLQRSGVTLTLPRPPIPAKP